MSINSTIVKTWLSDTPKATAQAKTKKEARAKIEKQFKTKAITGLRLETPPK